MLCRCTFPSNVPPLCPCSEAPAPLLYVQEWGLDKHVLAVAAWVPTPDYLPVQQQLLEELGRAAGAFRATPTGNPPGG
jgi:hypothetical protein